MRFVDDQGMIASSESELQTLMDRLYVNANKFDMKINVKNTKSMVVSRKGEGTVSIIVDGKRVEQVKRFKYLGSLIAEDGRCIEEVKQRIGMAKNACNKRRELRTKSMSKGLKKRVIKTLVWPVAPYGSETWTMTKEVRDKLEAFEM